MKSIPSYIFIICLLFGCTQASKKPVKRAPAKRNALSIMRTNDCFVCHSIEDHVDIPSYLMIAKRYDNTSQTIQTLKNKVLEGGGGNWGSVQMVKHPFIKESEAESIVKWVLSLDSDSVLAKNKINPTKISSKKKYPISLESYQIVNEKINFEDTVFQGSINELNLTGSAVLKEHSFIRIKGTIDINRRGKYFFKLKKTGIGAMYKDRNIIISDRKDDNEIMLELDKGSFSYKIEYSPNTSHDTLALFWLPPGKSYYELYKMSAGD